MNGYPLAFFFGFRWIGAEMLGVLAASRIKHAVSSNKLGGIVLC